MPTLTRLAGALVAVLTAPSASAAATAALTPAQFPSNDVVQRLIDAHAVGGPAAVLVVGLLEADGTTRTLTAGARDGSGASTAHAGVFEIGTLSHVLIGTLLAQMSLSGEASLDERVVLHMPAGLHGLPPGRFSASLGQLAVHEPGPHTPAANFTVGMLGQLLAANLGSSLHDIFRERVFEPLSMADTGPAPAPNPGLVSTVDDLLRFLASNVEAPGTELQRALREARRPRAIIDARQAVSFAWFVETVGGQRIFWHASVDEDHAAFLAFDPARGIGVVVLAEGGADMTELGFQLLSAASPFRRTDLGL